MQESKAGSWAARAIERKAQKASAYVQEKQGLLNRE
jgi:hypothetical protein